MQEAVSLSDAIYIFYIFYIFYYFPEQESLNHAGYREFRLTFLALGLTFLALGLTFLALGLTFLALGLTSSFKSQLTISFSKKAFNHGERLLCKLTCVLFYQSKCQKSQFCKMFKKPLDIGFFGFELTFCLESQFKR